MRMAIVKKVRTRCMTLVLSRRSRAGTSKHRRLVARYIWELSGNTQQGRLNGDLLCQAKPLRESHSTFAGYRREFALPTILSCPLVDNGSLSIRRSQDLGCASEKNILIFDAETFIEEILCRLEHAHLLWRSKLPGSRCFRCSRSSSRVTGDWPGAMKA
jgi:hypothetical protein